MHYLVGVACPGVIDADGSIELLPASGKGVLVCKTNAEALQAVERIMVRDEFGRTAGRHTSIVFAKNGELLGFGGKNSNIDGRMPLATSQDDGKTWTKSKLPFDPLASGERPSVIRLRSGRLFFVAAFADGLQRD